MAGEQADEEQRLGLVGEQPEIFDRVLQRSPS
jgi:hypothetical protein